MRESLFAYAQMCNGNLGAGILAVTFLVRLALLPLGVRYARKAAFQQRVMVRIQPELDALRNRYKDSPKRLAEESHRVMSREGLSLLSPSGCLGTLAPVPVYIALFSAVQEATSVGGRFLWIRDLAKPDWIVAIAATLLTALGTATGAVPPGQSRSLLLTITVVFTIVALSKMAAGVGLYWGMSSLFGAVQSWAVHRNLQAVKA
ncbi:MAG TPA: membrane protein insertase YidC [Vicinamibacterales bacterium]|nr:membrane protein insertase YidC [Vicinamibacterales bacterium]